MLDYNKLINILGVKEIREKELNFRIKTINNIIKEFNIDIDKINRLIVEKGFNSDNKAKLWNEKGLGKRNSFHNCPEYRLKLALQFSRMNVNNSNRCNPNSELYDEDYHEKRIKLANKMTEIQKEKCDPNNPLYDPFFAKRRLEVSRKAGQKSVIKMHKYVNERCNPNSKLYDEEFAENILKQRLKASRRANENVKNKCNPNSELYDKEYAIRHKKRCLNNLGDNVNQPNFVIKNGILYYKGKNWEEYQIKKINQLNVLNSVKDFCEKNNLIIIPTFRENNYNSKGKNAMIRYLLDKGIKYSYYIKFANNKPIIGGITKTINHDLCFDSYENCVKRGGSGAGRLFVENQNWKWNKDYIAIIDISYMSFSEAIKFEREMNSKLNLFDS